MLPVESSLAAIQGIYPDEGQNGGGGGQAAKERITSCEPSELLGGYMFHVHYRGDGWMDSGATESTHIVARGWRRVLVVERLRLDTWSTFPI